MSSTTIHSPSDIVRGLFAATDAKDTDAKLELITDDIRLTFGNAPPIEGKAAFRQTSDEFNASLKTVRHNIQSLLEITDQSIVIVELAVDYTRLDGDQLTLPCCNVFRLRAGRVADYRIYMDIGPVYA